MQAKANNRTTIIKKQRRRRFAAPIGGLFVILAAIGVVTVVISSIRLTASFLDNDREKKRFENIIRPVVMFNPVPFETPAAIDMMDLLRFSMWATLTGEKRSSYEAGDNTELIVPATDLDVAAARLFGSEVELVHQSFGDNETRYYYDEAEGVYNVPVAAQLYVYSPKVYEITKEGEFYNLYVGYIPPENAWTANYGGDSGEAVPDKYMIYVMRREGDTYQIAKLQDPPQELIQALDGRVQGQNS